MTILQQNLSDLYLLVSSDGSPAISPCDFPSFGETMCLREAGSRLISSMPVMDLPDMSWGEASAGCLPGNSYDLIRQNCQGHTHEDPPKINAPPPHPSTFDRFPGCLLSVWGSSSHPHFQPLILPLCSPLLLSSPSCFFSLFLYFFRHLLLFLSSDLCLTLPSICLPHPSLSSTYLILSGWMPLGANSLWFTW